MLLEEANSSNSMYVDSLLKFEKLGKNIHEAQQHDLRLGKMVARHMMVIQHMLMGRQMLWRVRWEVKEENGQGISE
ncbi:hypothetical protein RJT34_12207 [Clitoria ternatea]|uniref:Uncharacterized protein n=1 Tax=Clitoria ternatea TaxID=43366 RepID=A0AAN9JPX6_CLITE